MTQFLQPSEETRRVLLIDSEPKRQKHLKQVITRVFGAPEVRSTLGELPHKGSYNLVVAHEAGVPAEDIQRLTTYNAERGDPKVLLLSAGSDRSQISSLLGSRGLTNLLATDNDEELDVDELIVTCQKIMRRDIFGIEKYFVWGVPTRSAQITQSRNKPELLTAIQAYTSEIGIPQRLSALLETVADEFVSNALYNSPVTADGVHRFASTSRSKEIALEPHEYIDVRVCCDARRVGVSIKDPFGSLARDTVLDYLAKCFRKEHDQVDDKPGGAGLGFYQILDALSHFVINIQPGKTTEMIGLIDVRGSYKDFVVKGKSFNIFVVEG